MSSSTLAEAASVGTWTNAANGSVPRGAVVAGKLGNRNVYACRFQNVRYYQGRRSTYDYYGTLVGRTCNFVYGSRIYRNPRYQVLTGSGIGWVAAPGGRVPGDVIAASSTQRRGRTSYKYVCRANVSGGQAVGQLYGSRCLVENRGRPQYSTSFQVPAKGAQTAQQQMSPATQCYSSVLNRVNAAEKNRQIGFASGVNKGQEIQTACGQTRNNPNAAYAKVASQHSMANAALNSCMGQFKSQLASMERSRQIAVPGAVNRDTLAKSGCQSAKNNPGQAIAQLRKQFNPMAPCYNATRQKMATAEKAKTYKYPTSSWQEAPVYAACNAARGNADVAFAAMDPRPKVTVNAPTSLELQGGKGNYTINVTATDDNSVDRIMVVRGSEQKFIQGNKATRNTKLEGSVTFAAAGQGAEQISVIAMDIDRNKSAPQNLTISVGATNEPPVVQSLAFHTKQLVVGGTPSYETNQVFEVQVGASDDRQQLKEFEVNFLGATKSFPATKQPQLIKLQSPQAGKHQVQVVAVDQGGLKSAPKAIFANVLGADQPPTVSISAPSSVNEGNAFTAKVTAKDDRSLIWVGVTLTPDAKSILGYEKKFLEETKNLEFTKQLNGSQTSLTENVTINGSKTLPRGFYELRGLAIDRANGQRVMSAPVRVQVKGNNPAPTATVTGPTEVFLGANFKITLELKDDRGFQFTSVDINGNSKSISLMTDNNLTVPDRAAWAKGKRGVILNRTVDLKAEKAGDYLIQVKVRDTDGNDSAIAKFQYRVWPDIAWAKVANNKGVPKLAFPVKPDKTVYHFCRTNNLTGYTNGNGCYYMVNQGQGQTSANYEVLVANPDKLTWSKFSPGSYSNSAPSAKAIQAYKGQYLCATWIPAVLHQGTPGFSVKHMCSASGKHSGRMIYQATAGSLLMKK